MGKKTTYRNEKFVISVFTDEPVVMEIVFKYWDYDAEQNAFRNPQSDICMEYDLQNYSSNYYHWSELDELINVYSEAHLIGPIECRSCHEMATQVDRWHFSFENDVELSKGDGMTICKRCVEISKFESWREDNRIISKTHHLWRESDTSGYVYFLRAGQFCKIGKAKELSERIADIAPKFPAKVKFIHSLSSNDYHKLEKYLHKKFAKYRVNGEWFELPDKIIAILVGLSTWNSINGAIVDNRQLDGLLKTPEASLTHGVSAPKKVPHD